MPDINIAGAVAIILGAVSVVWLLTSVVRTVVIPRPERVFLTATTFEAARRLARWASRSVSPQRRHRILGTFAPSVLILLPAIWSLGLIIAFAAIFWGMKVGGIQEAIELSGSSLTTLGFVGAPTFVTRLIAIVEALLGLGIVALMISFLPTLYSTFSRREVAVGRLTTRAGAPPTPVSFITRLHEIDGLDRIGDRWEEWEDWFVELGETHTTFPALVYFRSARLDRHWVTAAETALDTAAIIDAIGLVHRTGQADTMIRSGYLAIRAIADHYRIAPEPADDAHQAISIDRSQFEAILDELQRRGIMLQMEPDAAWHRFAGWRANYDQAICGLQELTGPVPSHWTEAFRDE